MELARARYSWIVMLGGNFWTSLQGIQKDRNLSADTIGLLIIPSEKGPTPLLGSNHRLFLHPFCLCSVSLFVIRPWCYILYKCQSRWKFPRLKYWENVIWRSQEGSAQPSAYSLILASNLFLHALEILSITNVPKSRGSKQTEPKKKGKKERKGKKKITYSWSRNRENSSSPTFTGLPPYWKT